MPSDDGKTPSIRRLVPREWQLYRELRLRSLADSPDAFGGTLAEEKARSDLDWATRLASAEHQQQNLALVAEVGAEAVGLAWGRIEAHEAEVAHVYQMWVAPDFRGLGAGRRLLDTVVAWARERDAREVLLGVTSGDTPATRLYARAGFVRFGGLTPIRPGSSCHVHTMRLTLWPLG
jgi:ribosomal protein S18 acetylase RimI-like enzyme